jgi:hypothetical protein
VDLASTGSRFTFCENYTKTTNAASSKPQCEMAIEERQTDREKREMQAYLPLGF